MKIKTIDINAKQWFDKMNGNFYFAGSVTVNYGMKGEKTWNMPYQYGYGDQYIQEAAELLEKEKVLSFAIASRQLWQYCADNKIILRTDKQDNCLKRDLMRY
jgi:hypothetical protein